MNTELVRDACSSGSSRSRLAHVHLEHPAGVHRAATARRDSGIAGRRHFGHPAQHVLSIQQHMISRGGRFAPLRSLRLHGEWWTSPLLQLCLLSWLLAGASAQRGASAAAPAPADTLLAAASAAAAERESLSSFFWAALLCLHGTRLASSVALQGIVSWNDWGLPAHSLDVCLPQGMCY